MPSQTGTHTPTRTTTRTTSGGWRTLVRGFGGPRSAVGVAVGSVGTGLLRPFLLLYGVTVVHLSAVVTGAAMTAGVLAGLVFMPAVGWWLDRGARSTAAAAAMLVRVVGTVLLLATPAGQVWWFAVTAFVLGVGQRAYATALAALVTTLTHGRERDAALAAYRALSNAGLGVGALLATAALAGGATGLRALAVLTAIAYLAAAALAWSIHISAHPAADPTGAVVEEPGPRVWTLLAANVIYAFCLNVPEIALPLILVTRFHASPTWSAGIFVTNTVMVVALQVPVTAWMGRFPRHTALALGGVVITASYVGFLAADALDRTWAVPAIAAISVLCTLGEIIYTGSVTALLTVVAPPRVLGRALARFQLSTGLSLAVSPSVITSLAAQSAGLLWVALAVATLASACAVSRGSRRWGAGSFRRSPRVCHGYG